MTDSATIRKIGYRQAFKAITIGLVIAYFFMASMAGPSWLFQINYVPTIIFAALLIYGIGFLIGGRTGIWIFKRRQLSILFGIISGFLIVWTTTFSCSLIGFISEGLSNGSEISEAAHDYIYKPMVLVTLFGFLPIVLMGIWFGLSIKKRIELVFSNRT